MEIPNEPREGIKMKLNKRGRIVLIWIPLFIAVMTFTYATRDVCYVGNLKGNFLGYGSCNQMLDIVIGENK